MAAVFGQFHSPRKVQERGEKAAQPGPTAPGGRERRRLASPEKSFSVRGGAFLQQNHTNSLATGRHPWVTARRPGRPQHRAGWVPMGKTQGLRRPSSDCVSPPAK